MKMYTKSDFEFFKSQKIHDQSVKPMLLAACVYVIFFVLAALFFTPEMKSIAKVGSDFSLGSSLASQNVDRVVLPKIMKTF